MRAPLRCSASTGLVVFLSFLMTGCGPRTVPVTGKVTIKNDSGGKLTGYGVMFEQAEPGADGKTLSATGEIDAEGKFVLGTHSGSDGAYPGKYRDAITPSSEFAEGVAPPVVIDRKYYNLQTSGLEATVEAKATEFNWELDPANK
jgi:hypothetical protein